MYREYLRLIFKDIRFRKFSSFLTLFAITLGILSIHLIALIGQGFQVSVEKQFEQLGSNRIFISGTDTSAGGLGGKGLTDDEVNLILNKPYIAEASPFYIRIGQVKYGNDFRQGFILGMEFKEESFTDFNLEIEQGRFPQNNERYGAIIGPLAASELFDKEIPLGGNIYVKDTKFKVIGILKAVGNPQDDSQMYFNINTVRDIFGEPKKVNMIQANVVEGYDVEIAKQNLEIALENRLGKDKVEVRTSAQFLETFNSILLIIKMTLGGIALVSLLVGALGIINTMYVIVTEKIKDIGIMKSVGATNMDILLLYMLQAGIFGFLGAILGVTLGSILSVVFEYWAQHSGYTFLTITIDPFITIGLLIFGFIIGIFSGFLPAYRASKLKVVDALRK